MMRFSGIIIAITIALPAWGRAEGTAPPKSPSAPTEEKKNQAAPSVSPEEARKEEPAPSGSGHHWKVPVLGEDSEENKQTASAPPVIDYKRLSHDDVRLTGEVEDARPGIGDWVTYRISAEGPEGIEFKRAELPAKMPDYVTLRARNASAQTVKDGKVRKSWEFSLDFFFSGKFPLPPVVVTYKARDGKLKQLLAPLFFMDIQDLPLDPDSPQDIRPIKPVTIIPVSHRKAYLVGGAVLGSLGLVGLGLFLFVRWLRKPEILPSVPAHEIAYEQMRRLVEARLIEQELVEEYYVRLSNICRKYLENRFGLKAPERTTEEFFIIMAETNYLTPAHKKLVKDFLGHCDLVKFARYGPTEEEMREAFNSAKRLVDETRPGEASPESTQPEEAVPAGLP